MTNFAISRTIGRYPQCKPRAILIHPPKTLLLQYLDASREPGKLLTFHNETL